MDYYTSDLHLGHNNVLSHRPMFDTTDEMDEALISNWNRKVGADDHIYILGDLCYRSKASVESYLERLNGQKHLIIGNHDSSWLKGSNFERLSAYFVSIDSLITVKKNKVNITLCHYPMLEWSGSRYAANRSSWLIHGYIHNYQNAIYDYIKENQPTALNCGVDVNNFEPVTFEELIKNNCAWYGREDNEQVY